MTDPLTAVALAGGVLFIVLWYKSATRTHRRRVAPEGRTMSITRRPRVDSTQVDRIIRALPDDLRPDQLAQRLGRDLLAFQQSESLAEQFFLQLRQRFSAKWDAEMLRRAAEVVNAEKAFMEAVFEHDVLRTTAAIQRDTRIVEAQNAHLSADDENAKLRRGASKRTAEEHRGDEIADLDHRLAVLRKTKELRELEAELAKAATSSPPKPEKTDAQRRREAFLRELENAGALIKTHIEFQRFVDEAVARAAEAGLKPGDDAYEHIMNILDAIRQRLTR